MAHQLIKVGRLLNEIGLHEAKKSFGLDNLSQTHLDLYPHIAYEGSTITDIAHKKGVSKQAVSKLVNEMIHMGLLEMKPHSEDGRAKVVKFKTKGPFAITKGFKVLERIDSKLQQQMGETRYSKLIKDLNQVMNLFEDFC